MSGQEHLDWQHRADYIRVRHSTEPAWADEAFADPAALNEHPDHASKSGQTDRLTGYSPTAGMVLTVIWMPDTLIGVNAWSANTTDTRRYWENR